MHGVIFNRLTTAFQIVADPNGIGTTTFNGINDQGGIVGFYVGGDSFTRGLLAIAVPASASFLLLATGLTALMAGRRRQRV